MGFEISRMTVAEIAVVIGALATLAGAVHRIGPSWIRMYRERRCRALEKMLRRTEGKPQSECPLVLVSISTQQITHTLTDERTASGGNQRRCNLCNRVFSMETSPWDVVLSRFGQMDALEAARRWLNAQEAFNGLSDRRRRIVSDLKKARARLNRSLIRG